VVLPFVAVGATALLGAVALVVDLGRLMLVRAELQVAADACALSAVQELDQTARQMRRAQAAGRFAANQVPRGLPLVSVSSDAATTVRFSSASTAPVNSSDYAAPTDTATPQRFARCEVSHTGSGSLIGNVIGLTSLNGQIVAQATAGTAPSARACMVPLALDVSVSDSPTVTTDQGFARNRVYYLIRPQYAALNVLGLASVNFGSGLSNYNVRLVDFGAPAGATTGAGVDALMQQVARGICDIDTANLPQTNRYAPLFTATADVDRLWEPWNARFGIYRAGSSLIPSTAAPANGVLPDLTGWAPDPPSLQVSGLLAPLLGSALQVVRESPRFSGATASYQFHAGERTATPSTALPLNFQPYGPNGTALSTGNHRALGASGRRLAILPITRTASSGNAQQRNIVDFACVWLYRPIGEADGSSLRTLLNISINGSTNYKLSAAVEFLGLASDSDSPCRSSGPPGPSGSKGPLVATLVR